MEIILSVATIALIVIAGQTILNTFLLRRLQPAFSQRQPLVSILIPARNEALVIADTVRQLCAQDYPHLEFLVLDDNSTDGTAAMARAAGTERLRVLTGESLPAGWAGKNWACQQLAAQASGELLLFTDADTQWHPQAVSSLVAFQQRTQADLLTAWPTQIMVSASERLVVPLMNFVILGYLPIFLTQYSRFPAFGAANGQCMLWQRPAYERVGGHRSIASSVLDDVMLARRVKASGLTLRMVDGGGLVRCRMYQDWPSVRDGFAKNILAGYGNSIPALIAAAIFHALLFLLPWLLLLIPPWQAWGLAMITLALGTRALSAVHSRQNPADALWLPVSVLAMQMIALQAIRWHFRGGPRWKDRTLTQSKDMLWTDEQSSSSVPASVD